MTKSRYTSDRDGRLRRTYGRSEKEVDSVIGQQEGGCAACGGIPKTKNLHVDHDHKIEKWKVDSKKCPEGHWVAWPRNTDNTPVRLLSITEQAKTKSEAIKKVKRKLKRVSCRGLLDWSCNSAAKSVRDNPEIARGLANYLQNYYNFLDGKQNTTNGFTE